MTKHNLSKLLLGALLCLAFATIPRDAAAQNEQCKKVFTDLAPTCDPLATALARQSAINVQLFPMKADDPLRASLTTELTTLQAQIKTLQANPLARVCESWPVPVEKQDCDHLATILGVVVEESPSAKSSAQTDADVQRAQVPENRTSTNKSGGPGQGGAVESLQPINLAGGAFSLAGTRAGTRGVATITVNPLALGNPKDAVSGRLFDLSVTSPFALDGSSSQNLRFVSMHARVNATAPISAKPLQDALNAYYAASGTFEDNLEGVLLRAPNLNACVQSIVATRQITAAACGATVPGQAALAKFRADSIAAVAAARKEADRYYLGLDLQLDAGDPTGTTIVGDKGTRVQGALAGGLHISQGDHWGFEIRGHAGGDYFRGSDAMNGVQPDPVFSVDWGGALVLAGQVPGPTDKQHITFGAGVQGRNAKDTTAAATAPTNFVNLNLMAIVPAAGGADMGIMVSVPLLDSKVPQGTIISVSTDLGLLDGSSTQGSTGGT